MMVGLPHRPSAAGKGRTGPGLPRLAFNGGDQGRLFAADKGAGALPDFQAKAETGAEDILAQKA